MKAKTQILTIVTIATVIRMSTRVAPPSQTYEPGTLDGSHINEIMPLTMTIGFNSLILTIPSSRPCEAPNQGGVRVGEIFRQTLIPQ